MVEKTNWGRSKLDEQMINSLNHLVHDNNLKRTSIFNEQGKWTAVAHADWTVITASNVRQCRKLCLAPGAALLLCVSVSVLSHSVFQSPTS